MINHFLFLFHKKTSIFIFFDNMISKTYLTKDN